MHLSIVFDSIQHLGRISPRVRTRFASVPAWVISGSTFAVLVALMWSPFTMRSGFPYETLFPYMSETQGWWGGFFYTADPLRIHTNTFYHLSYLVGEFLGVGGSYVPYQVVHAVLWWARGFLAFLIVDRLFAPHPAVAFAVGAFTIVHASDGALQWVGQLNQFGFIFWMLLAFYLLVRAIQSRSRLTAAAVCGAACFCEYMSLWSYESQLFLLAVFPGFLFFVLPRERRRLLAVAGPWYSIISLYVWLTFQKYVESAGGTYQESVLRKDWSVSALASDFWFNVVASLAFWRWLNPNWRDRFALTLVIVGCAVTVFVIILLLLMRFTPAIPSAVPADRAGSRSDWNLLVTGTAMLLLAFPVYLVLQSARLLWRTQLLSGFGAAAVLAGMFWIVTNRIPANETLKTTLFAALCTSVVACGTVSALQKGAAHRSYWERHRAVIADVLRVAPSVRSGSIVMLTNVPRADDPFEHTMWFDLALRLVYMPARVSGVYYYADGTPAPGHNLKLIGDRWVWDGNGYPPIVRETPVENALVIGLHREKGAGLLSRFPEHACDGRCPSLENAASRLITGTTVSDRAARRYRLTIPALPTAVVGDAGIEVKRATYGANCANVAVPNGWTNTVTIGNATAAVANTCNGLNACEFTVTTDELRDPAPFCAKDFSVEWSCADGRVNTAHLDPEANAKTVQLVCGR